MVSILRSSLSNLKRIRYDVSILRCLSNHYSNVDSNVHVDNQNYSNKIIVNNKKLLKNDVKMVNNDMNVMHNDININAKRTYERGEQIQVKIIEFIRDIGALVSIVDGNNNNKNNNNIGLISNQEMDYYKQIKDVDLRIDNVLIGYVNRIREDGKVDVGLRLPSKERSKEAEKSLLNLLKNTGSLPIGDKSDAESIGKLLPGISKGDFKKMIGSLYKQRKIEPGPYEVKIISENKTRKSDKTKTTNSKDKHDGYENDNNKNNIIFLGNLPSQLSQEEGLKLLKELLKDITISKFILGISKTDNLPTCHGHLVLKDPLEMNNAMKILRNENILGRKMRVEEGKVLPKSSRKIKINKNNDISSTVSVFHRSLTEEMVRNEIEKIFDDYKIENVINTTTLRYDSCGRFLHVDFLNKKLADVFIYEMNGKIFDGAKLKATHAQKISSKLLNRIEG